MQGFVSVDPSTTLGVLSSRATWTHTCSDQFSPGKAEKEDRKTTIHTTWFLNLFQIAKVRTSAPQAPTPAPPFAKDLTFPPEPSPVLLHASPLTESTAQGSSAHGHLLVAPLSSLIRFSLTCPPTGSLHLPRR